MNEFLFKRNSVNELLKKSVIQPTETVPSLRTLAQTEHVSDHFYFRDLYFHLPSAFLSCCRLPLAVLPKLSEQFM